MRRALPVAILVIAFLTVVLFTYRKYISSLITERSSHHANTVHHPHEQPPYTDLQSHLEDTILRHPQETPELKHKYSTFQPLSLRVVKGIKKFVFFVGYGKTGHSILGSIIDAHPHVIISHEFHIFRHWRSFDTAAKSLNWTTNLFNMLYKKSYKDAMAIRNSNQKGYTLKIDGLWQGRYDKYLQIIGDKSGGSTTKEFLRNRPSFVLKYERLKRKLTVPISLIHAVRNPFDLISTHVLYAFNKTNIPRLRESKINEKAPSWKFNDSARLEEMIERIFHILDAIMGQLKIFKDNPVLEVHNCDLVSDPVVTISGICKFLDLDCSEEYLELCAGKIFKSVSRTRELVVWPLKLRKEVEQRMRNYAMFERYTFSSD